MGQTLGIDPRDVALDSEIERDLGFDDESYWQDLLFRIARHFHLPSFTESKHSKLVEIRKSCITVENLCSMVEQKLPVAPIVA